MAEQRRTGTFENKFKFNGKELDSETGLYYYGARYYNPRTSVWLSVDPIALWQPVQESEHYILGQHNGGYFNPKNMSVYGYTYQNPILYVDPNGKQTVWWKREAVKANFSHDLPKKFVDNYASGEGKSITLTAKEMADVQPQPVSINRGVSAGSNAKNHREQEASDFENMLSTLSPGQTSAAIFRVKSKASNNGTLGTFTITFAGSLTKGKDGESWNFEGNMFFYDLWDFDLKPAGERTQSSESATEKGAEWLEGGKGFEIFSESIPVKQSSKDNFVDWWKGREIQEVKARHNSESE